MHLVQLPAEGTLPLLQRSWKKSGKFFVDTKRDFLKLHPMICTFMSPMEKTKIIRRVLEGDCRALWEACQMPPHEAARSSWKSRRCPGHPLQRSWRWQSSSASSDGCSDGRLLRWTATTELLKWSESKAWRGQEELFMLRGNVSWRIIAFRLLLDSCFLAALKPLLLGWPLRVHLVLFCLFISYD